MPESDPIGTSGTPSSRWAEPTPTSATNVASAWRCVRGLMSNRWSSPSIGRRSPSSSAPSCRRRTPTRSSARSPRSIAALVANRAAPGVRTASTCRTSCAASAASSSSLDPIRPSFQSRSPGSRPLGIPLENRENSGRGGQKARRSRPSRPVWTAVRNRIILTSVHNPR